MSLAGAHVFAPGYRPEHDTSSMSKLERLEYEADRALWDADPEFSREVGISAPPFPPLVDVSTGTFTNSAGPR